MKIVTNETETKDTFEGRKQYKADSSLSFDPTPIDYLYERGFYGKVDLEFNSMCLRNIPNLVKPVDSLNPGQFVLNFVADAFNDMKTYVNACKTRGLIIPSEDDFLFDFKSVRGAQDPVAKYHEFMMIHYNLFVNKYITLLGRDQHIKNFSDFVDAFMEYSLEFAGMMPVTQASYITSRFFNPMETGLCIEVVEQVKDSNFNKYYFRAGEHYLYFIKTARKFGFKVDKNVPWRLVANLRSPRMHYYIQRYSAEYQEFRRQKIAKPRTEVPALPPVKLDNLFKKYYHKAYVHDVRNLQVYLAMFYESYIKAFPYVEQPGSYRGSDGMCVVKSKKIYRTPLVIYGISPDDDTTTATGKYVNFLNEQYGEVWWLMKYYKIRGAENGKTYDKPQLKRDGKKIAQLNKYFGYNRALEEINDMALLPKHNRVVSRTTKEPARIPPPKPESVREGLTAENPTPPEQLEQQAKAGFDVAEMLDAQARNVPRRGNLPDRPGTVRERGPSGLPSAPSTPSPPAGMVPPGQGTPGGGGGGMGY